MFVVTADQQSSRMGPDLVPGILRDIEDALGGAGVVLPFERTAGDEVQGVLDDPAAVLGAVLRLTRAGTWYVGVGIGAVELPLGATSRASRGQAFLRARSAVSAAKTKGLVVPLALCGTGDRCSDAEALITLLAAVRSRRSPAGWQACDAMADAADNQSAVAASLGISPQAMSGRLRAALYYPETACHTLALRLLREADEEASASDMGVVVP